MASKTESGHAVNVANFNELISYVTGYNTAYNPSNTALALTALQTIATNAGNSIDAVYSSIPAYSLAVNQREEVFAPLSKLVTRVMNFLRASGVSQQVYDSVNTVARKIKGARASAKITTPAPDPNNPETPEVRQVSASQISYDMREENFEKLIQMLAAIPQYAPNEEELTTTSLSALCNQLSDSNAAVIAAEVPLSNARIARNQVLYAATTGLCDIAQSVKMYIKAVFGATSAQYRQISKLKFTKAKL
uniref:hypothetical protein n=1 Tax=uncultured Draconibacterium sp. TaxID=1573823 RepID=UPI003216C774